MKAKRKLALLRKAQQADDFDHARHLLIAHASNASDVGKKFLSFIRRLRPEGSCSKVVRIMDLKPGSVFDPKESMLIENECKLSRCSLFAMCSHSKKRPHNVIFARMYDNHLLDAFEFGIDRFEINHKNKSVPLAISPFIVTEGIIFGEYSSAPLRSFFIQFFQGGVAMRRFNLFTQSQWVLVMRGAGDNENMMQIRGYMCNDESGCLSNECLFEIDLTIRRSSRASDLLYKKATSKPLLMLSEEDKKDPKKRAMLYRKKTIRTTEKKNIKVNQFGSKVAKIHIGRQHVDKMQSRKVKALRSSKKRKPEIK